jgi:predicted O-methyltransferase YrrM
MINLDFLNSQKEVTYHVEDFKGWHEEKQFTGDIWNGGIYKWKIEGLKAIIQQLQPKVIFETGFNVGHSVTVMLNYCDSNCKVYSIDKNENCKKYGDKLSEVFPNFELIIGDTVEKLEEILEEKQLEIDLAFIDGSHHHTPALNDITRVQEYMNDGGCILVDDKRLVGVKDAVKESNWDGYKEVGVPKWENGGTFLYQKK